MGKSDSADCLIKQLFGDVDENTKKATVSKVSIRESIIEGGEPMRYTRTKVDRFTGGIVNSALFDEMPHYGGNVRLDISIKNLSEDEKWGVGLILLALKDMGNGIQPVGGDANIGRGILKKLNIEVNDNENKTDYLKAVAEKLQEQGEA